MKSICIIKGDKWRDNLQCPLVPLLKHKLKRKNGNSGVGGSHRKLPAVVSQMWDQQKLDLCTSLSHITPMASDKHVLAQRHANPINPARKRSLQFLKHTHTCVVEGNTPPFLFQAFFSPPFRQPFSSFFPLHPPIRLSSHSPPMPRVCSEL